MPKTLLEQIAEQFARELARWCAVTGEGTRSWDRPSLRLTIEHGCGAPNVLLQFSAQEVTVKGIDLGVIMDEAYRRQGYNGKAQAAVERLNNSLLALPSPSDGSDQ